MSGIFGFNATHCTALFTDQPDLADACTSILQMLDISPSVQKVYENSYSILSQSLLWTLSLTVSTASTWGHVFKKSHDYGGPFLQLIWVGSSMWLASNLYYKVVGDRIDLDAGHIKRTLPSNLEAKE